MVAQNKLDSTEVFQSEIPSAMDSSLYKSQSVPTKATWHSMFTDIPSDLFRVGEKIIDPKNIPTIVGLAALTGIAIYTDKFTAASSLDFYHKNKNLAKISDGIAFVGDGRAHFLFAIAMGTTGYFIDNPKMMHCATQLVEVELAAGITVQILKHITGKESPQAATSPRGRHKFFPSIKEYHSNEQKYYSYPSGHVATTMAAVTVLAENFPEEKWIKPVGYVTTGLVAISLVNKGWHWYSDFPLAVAIGYVFGKVISHKHDSSDAAQSDVGLSFHPTFLEAPGIGITYRF